MTMLDHPCCSIRIAQTHSGKLILSCPNPQRGQQPCNAERPPRCACTALRFPLASSCAKRSRRPLSARGHVGGSSHFQDRGGPRGNGGLKPRGRETSGMYSWRRYAPPIDLSRVNLRRKKPLCIASTETWRPRKQEFAPMWARKSPWKGAELKQACRPGCQTRFLRDRSGWLCLPRTAPDTRTSVV